MEKLYLKFLIICKEIRQDESGAYSFIHTFDGLTANSNSLGDEEINAPPIQIGFSFFSEDEAKSYVFDLVLKTPSGSQKTFARLPMGYNGTEFIGNAAFGMPSFFIEEGLYFVQVYLGNQLFAQHPLEIQFQPQDEFLYE